MKRRVLVASFYNRQAIAPALERLATEADVILCDEGRSLTEAKLIRHLDRIDVVIAADEPYNARVFERARQLRMIARDGVGVDNIDLTAATHHGVIVNNAPVIHETVADLTFGLIIATIRKIAICDRGVRQGQWADRDTYMGRDVHGMTLGVLGFGNNGRAVARRAAGFNMTVLAHDPYVDPALADQLGVRLVSLDELLQSADVISIHTALTPETRNIINAQTIAKMKDGAFLVNVSRGAVIDESALIAALKSGKLAGAGLDVLRSEPPVRQPLFDFDNVVFTPHVGSDTVGAFAKVFESVVTDILLLFAGKWPLHVINQDVKNHERFSR